MLHLPEGTFEGHITVESGKTPSTQKDLIPRSLWYELCALRLCYNSCPNPTFLESTGNDPSCWPRVSALKLYTTLKQTKYLGPPNSGLLLFKLYHEPWTRLSYLVHNLQWEDRRWQCSYLQEVQVIHLCVCLLCKIVCIVVEAGIERRTW